MCGCEGRAEIAVRAADARGDLPRCVAKSVYRSRGVQVAVPTMFIGRSGTCSAGSFRSRCGMAGSNTGA
jgi:hypothetical protein